MNKTVTIKKSIKLVSAALATGGLLAAGASVNASMNQNPFSMERLPSGYMVADSHKAAGDKPPCDRRMSRKDGDMKKGSGESKCGEGSCGGMKKSSGESKCGEGSCGGMKKGSGESKCGEGSCGGMKKSSGESKCGEGSCGGTKKSSGESK